MKTTGWSYEEDKWFNDRVTFLTTKVDKWWLGVPHEVVSLPLLCSKA